MHALKIIGITLVSLLMTPACGRRVSASGTESLETIKYRGHELDLSRLEINAPRAAHMVGSLENQSITLMMPPDEMGRNRLGTLSFSDDERRYFEDARIAPTVAWERSLTFDWKLSQDRTHLFLTKDIENDEHFNIYSIDLASAEQKKLTNSAYVPGFALSHDSRYLVYASRQRPEEGSPVEIRILDLISGEDRFVFSDESMEVKFPWANFAWSPDDQTIVAVAQYGQDRGKGTLVKFAAQGPSDPEVLLPPGPNRLFLKLGPQSMWGQFVFFMSPETGTGSLMALNLKTKDVTTVFGVAGSNLTAFFMVERRSQVTHLIAVADGIRGTRIAQIPLGHDTWSPSSVMKIPYSSTRILDINGDKALMVGTSAFEPTTVFQMDLDSGKTQTVVSVRAESLDAGIHCNVEEVFYKTFDNLSYELDGEVREGEIYARLYTPKVTHADWPRLAVVQSFYGGSNTVQVRTQSFCAAGVTVLSPAVRGVQSVGAAYELLNDGDLGGQEIIDGQYAARWLQERLQIEPWQIGSWGASHGGYATQRQLTMPNSSDREGFSWGFGISESGFSSIRGEYELSNIKAWISKEAGGTPDNPTDLARWEDRSPINHVRHLKAPLLLLHGTADRRVPFQLSQQLKIAAEEQGLGHLIRLVPIEGAGHSLELGPPGRQTYASILEFLEALPSRP